MPAGVEDRVVVRGADLGERLRGGELLLHDGVVEEALVGGEGDEGALVHGRVRALGRGEVDVVLGREDWERASGARSPLVDVCVGGTSGRNGRTVVWVRGLGEEPALQEWT